VIVTEGLTTLYGLSHQRQKSPTEQVAALSVAGMIEPLPHWSSYTGWPFEVLW